MDTTHPPTMDTTFRVKQEPTTSLMKRVVKSILKKKHQVIDLEEPTRNVINNVVNSINKKHQVIDLDSDSDGDDDDGSSSEGERKRARSDLPAGFLDPLPVKEKEKEKMNDCKQFWKAGDFEDGSGGNWETPPGGMDHVRVHPRFLHSNATSHKWVLGAFAELLDNSLDEVCNGATYANIDMLKNKKDGSRMLVIEDNGGGMDPDKLRQCMSLGYSLKSKVADTIGQYGNGFKTSTMRLGADVIVFTRCSAKNGKRATQSIGLLSYTFLRVTGKEDIVVPMVDYERGGRELKKIIRASRSDWDINIDALVKWSPFSSEADLLKQFDHMSDQGTRIIIYNLWEDDQGQLELDFDADAHDIQIRGVNRDEKNIHMANEYPNSRHFLTYRHSLRSYASILYLRIPSGFRMVLRGKDIQHHNIVNDMMMTTEVTYRPLPGGAAKDSNIVAVVTMGFVKDAKAHIDVQGYNVYHKNRLIKPFWRLWTSAGSDGRGVIGVLEANFVEPAHDKQGFERTIVLSRLETRLIQMQKTYWRTYCHKIGYAPRVNKNNLERERSPDFSPETSKKKKAASSKHPAATVNGFREGPNSPPLTENIHEDDLHRSMNTGNTNGSSHKGMPADNFPPKYREREWSPDFSPETSSKKKKAASSKHPAATVNGFREGPNSPPLTENIHEDDLHRSMNTGRTNGSSHKGMPADNFPPKYGSHSASPGQHAANGSPYEKTMQMVSSSQSRFAENGGVPLNSSMPNFDQLVEENRILKEKLSRKDEDIVGELLHDLERERKYCKELEAQIEEIKGKSEHMYKEQETIIDIFAEERERRDVEEETLRKKLKEATATIQDLVERVKQLELEKMKTQNGAWRKN